LTACVCLFAADATIAHARSRPLKCSQVYWRTSRDRDQRCPYGHSVLADISYGNLHWTSWTRAHAEGHGEELAFDDAPGPPAGSIVQPIAIKLTRPRRCTDGRSIYTRTSLTFYAAKLTIPLGAPIPSMPTTGRIGSRVREQLSCNPTGGLS
jgi:hypothetical protein